MNIGYKQSSTVFIGQAIRAVDDKEDGHALFTLRYFLILTDSVGF
jgi:hypothetical protein